VKGSRSSADQVPSRDLWASVGVLVVVLFRWWQQWLHPEGRAGNVYQYVHDVVAGRAPAPYQYRPGAPWLIAGLESVTGASTESALLVVNAIALLVGWIGFALLLVELRRVRWLVPGTLVIALLASGTMWWDKPETYVAFALTSITSLALLRSGRAGMRATVACGLLLVVVRLDLAVAFGVALLWRWHRDRRPDDLVGGAVLVGAGVTALTLMTAHWHASYPEGVSVVQLGHNVTPPNFVGLLGLSLLLLALCRPIERTIAVLAVALAVQTAFICTVGMIEELRLWFPMASVIALLVVSGLDRGAADVPLTTRDDARGA
jgi:hypothetical protein